VSAKVLVIRFSSLGDVVLATAALNAIQAMKPGSQLVFLTKAAYAPLLEGHPALKEVWAWEGDGLGMLRRIRDAHFDHVLDLHGKPRSRLFSALSGAASRARMKNHAWNRRLRVWLRSSSLPMPPDVARRGILAAAEMLGAEAVDARPSVEVSAAAAAWAEAFLKEAGVGEGDTVIAVSPGAAWATKRWSEGAFAQAMGLLAEPGRRFLFVGDASDRDAASRIISYARRGAELAINAAGRTDFCQLAALLRRSKALLSNDSGPMHLAGAVGTPVVALFGPTVEAFGFFPRGPKDLVLQRELSCRPCSVHGSSRCPLGTHACMEGIAPFDVSRGLEGILRG
jgi:heptosyltransferase-2